eukprot:Blabericola_migrator_1__7493@NODE_3825_length_1484_cov_58_305575_g2372_i0_p2_GENE_NODE_3825_length_1484_cov_58_305575_g2372_i0NODE_3825_length_1484_cov_58_305575_g2372_i0_p2_ORF_typecomplete_len146_score22_40_NODE_3825_length_1484_cov_58_305575_g2372_i05951032
MIMANSRKVQVRIFPTMSSWCCSVGSTEKCPSLVMPSEMVKTFFTRLRLHLSNVEEEARRRENEGITLDQFDVLASSLKRRIDTEIESIKRSYARTVLLHEEKAQHQDPATWTLLVDGPAKRKVTKQKKRSRETSTEATTGATHN